MFRAYRYFKEKDFAKTHELAKGEKKRAKVEQTLKTSNNLLMTITQTTS